MEQIGILGGSFDPIHIGHLIMALISKEEFSLSKVYFVPTNLSYHKGGNELSPKERYQITNLAIQDYPSFVISDIDIKRGGKTYTVDTLKEFKKYHNLPNDTVLYFIMGIDSYMTITTWKDYKSIFELANLIVYNRPCFDINSLPKELLSYKNVYFIKEPTIGISSSFIRERLRQGKSCHFFIPKKALEYIQENMLYR